jgi:hypothetical protein
MTDVVRNSPILQTIVQRYVAYTGAVNADVIIRAYDYALAAHAEQRRATGEPYIIHPLAVAEILTELEVDRDTLMAALLHDTVEDTSKTIEDIKVDFGEDIANLVDGVTKLSRIPYSSKEEIQAENFRKMFLAMAKDIRVVLIKLADRLHNMRTMRHMSPDKQQEKARETLDIYAPLAHRLGIYKIKWELEDLACATLTATPITSWWARFRKNVRNAKNTSKRSLFSCRPKSAKWASKQKLKAGQNIFTVSIEKWRCRTRVSTRSMIFLRPGSLSTLWLTVMPCWALSMSCINRCPAVLKITSPCPNPTCISRCTRL